MIWKVKYKKIYGPKGQYSYDDTKFYYDEKSMLRDLKKLPSDVKGTIEIYENTATFGIAEHLDSLKREVQLGSILEVADEKSALHSRFIEIFSESETEEPTKSEVIKEWEFLPKTDDAMVKKFFAKYRNLFLLGCASTVDWYKTLLSIYSYANIADHAETEWFYCDKECRYMQRKRIVKRLTEEQKENYAKAKNLLKSSEEKKAKKK